MEQKTITIPMNEYKKLKKLEKLEGIDTELLAKIINSLKDAKEGKITEWID